LDLFEYRPLQWGRDADQRRRDGDHSDRALALEHRGRDREHARLQFLLADGVPVRGGLYDFCLEPGGGFRITSGQRRQVLAALLGRQAGQQHPGAGPALKRQRLAGLERDAQPLRRLDPVYADCGPADQPDQDDGLAGLGGQLAHHRLGDVDDALRGLRRPGQPDQPGRQPVGAALVAGQQPGLAEQRNVPVDAWQRDAGGGGQVARGQGVLVRREGQHQGEDAARSLAAVRGACFGRHLDCGCPGHSGCCPSRVVRM
jgi:hypothetical protein